MANTKANSPNRSNALVTSGLSGKSITGLDIYQHGSTIVIEINYTGGPQYVKVNRGRVEVGGTEDFGTGTQVLS